MAAGLLVLAGAASAVLGADAPKKPVELVVARLEGDVDWAVAHKANATVTVYNQGSALDVPKGVDVVELPQAGNEAHAFLHHIVTHYGSLAEKVVFLPGQKPTTGFQGFRHGAATMLPGVNVKDYASKASPALFVPTMAFTSNLQQVSVRTAYMEGQPESEAERFSVCSPEGNAGWSPFMPNTYSSSVLEPLMAKQQKEGGEVVSFQDFWAKHMPETSIPDVLRVAHGSIFSVDRKAILQRPKAFYEKLLADVRDEKLVYPALFVEAMWWYLFHGAAEQICPDDLSTSSTAPASSRRRKLAAAIMLLTPKAGDKFKFGQVMKIDWSTVYAANTVPFRVEIWKYGEFQTRIEDSTYSTTFEWMVTPDAADAPWKTNTEGSGETFTRFNLVPGDDYTIRVCDGSLDASQPVEEQICDDTYSESGEFALEPTLTMLEPDCSGTTITSGANVQVVWSSYYISAAATLTISLSTGDYFELWSESGIANTGYYNFWAPFDMPVGSYRFKVTADCSDCAVDPYVSGGVHVNPQYMVGTYSTVEASTCPFTLATGTSPPAPPPSSTPNAPWEIPIIKAFESGLGGSVYTPNTGADSFVISESSDCYQVCTTRGRRLLFGGLNYLSGSGLPCSAAARQCNCAGC